MASIIRAAELTGTTRQLRRPAAIAAQPVSVEAPAKTGAATPPPLAATLSQSLEAGAVMPAAAMVAAMAPLASTGPVAAVAPVQLHALDVARDAPMPALAPAVGNDGGQLEQLKQLEQLEQLEQSRTQFQREQKALAAAQAALAEQRAALDKREQALRAGEQQLADESAAIKSDAERRGHEQGVEQGVRTAGEESAAHIERLNAVLQAVRQARRTLLDDNEDMLVEIVFTAVCRLLGRHGATRAGIESMVRSLVESEREAMSLTVRLHPEDARMLAAHAAEIDARVQFQADTSVTLGGCLIDNGRGVLDARLEQQISHLREALISVRRQREQWEAPV